MDPNYTNPVQRFRTLMADTSAPSLPAELSPDALSGVITRAQADQKDVPDALASHVALYSRLDLAHSQDLVAKSLQGQTDASAQAHAVSAAASAASPSGQIDLSDPVMLWPGARLGFSVALALAVLGSIAAIWGLGSKNVVPPTATFVCLAVAGGLALLGLLILVMGYKNVKISGSK
jgi:hypothetical protein